MVFGEGEGVFGGAVVDLVFADALPMIVHEVSISECIIY